MKAKKGNPFERLVAYNLIQCSFHVDRLDDNTKGIDLIATNRMKLVIECKHHKGFSYNQLEKIFVKTEESASELLKQPNQISPYIPMFIFKSNNQPILVMYRTYSGINIMKFEDYFETKVQQIPKGYKVWKEN